MKLWEIELKEGLQYTDNISSKIWTIYDTASGLDLWNDAEGVCLKNYYSFEQLLNIVLNKIDWTTVSKDAKVVCSNFQGDFTIDAHFCRYEKDTNTVVVYGCGRTSHTTDGKKEHFDARYVKLY